MLKQTTRTFTFIMVVFAIILFAGNLRDSVVEASQSDSKVVTLIMGGTKKSVSTKVTTVGDLLHEENVTLDGDDKISHPINAKLSTGMHITIKKVEIKEVSKVEAIPFETIYVASNQKAGSILEQGSNGEKKVTYKVTYVDGKEFKKTVMSSLVTKQAVPCKASCGSKVSKTKRTTSRHSSYGTTKKVITMKATAYAAESFRRSRTALGTRAVRGVVAVDPRVIPLGTKLYIEGYGYAVAADTGGAIKGYRIDLVMNTVRECRNFGRRQVKVHILN